jgi:Spore coat associated protein JA (CotJA).
VVTSLSTSRKWFYPYVSPFDPCPPLTPVSYETPVQLYLGFQPVGLRQYAPAEALKMGTLWPELYSPYVNPYQQLKREGDFNG